MPLSGEESESDGAVLGFFATGDLPRPGSGEESRLFLAGGGERLRCASRRRDCGEGEERAPRGCGELPDLRRPLAGGDGERLLPFLSNMWGELRRRGDDRLRLRSSDDPLLFRRSLEGGEAAGRRRSPGGGDDAGRRRLLGEGERCFHVGFLNGGGDSEPDEDDPDGDLARVSSLFCTGMSDRDPFPFFTRTGDGESDPDDELSRAACCALRGLAGEAELESRRARRTGETSRRRGGGEGLRRGGGDAEDMLRRRRGGGDTLGGERVLCLHNKGRRHFTSSLSYHFVRRKAIPER